MLNKATVLKMFIPFVLCLIIVGITLKEGHGGSNLDNSIILSEILKRETENCTRMSDIDLCYMCKQQITKNISQQRENVTICYTKHYGQNETVQPSTTLKKILQLLPKNTTHLQIVLDNTWHGYLPMRAYPLDLTDIVRLDQLLSLNVSQHSDNYIQLFPLHFTNQTFSKMKKLKELVLDVPVKDQSLKGIVSHMESLELLFLQPRGISMVNMSDTISNIHPNATRTLQELHISTFQLMGMDGYNGTLVMKDFLHNRTFPHVRYLYLKGNSLTSLHTGWTDHFPNVELVDISYNLLTGTLNIATFMETLTHQSCVDVNLQHQGYIGGGVVTSDHGRAKHPLHRYRRFLEAPNDIFNNQSRLYANFVFIVKCVNQVTHNISIVFNSAVATKSVMACILSVSTSEVFVHIFPAFGDIFNAFCMLFIEIPVGPKVTHIHFSDVHLEESTFKGFAMTGDLCIQRPNQLQVVDISNNQGWMPMSKLNETLKHMTGICGLENIEQLILRNNYLEINASVAFKQGNFPKLRALNMGGNHLLIDKTYSFCASTMLISHLDVQGNNLGQRHGLKNFVRNCTNLETLILSDNGLNEKTLHDIDLTGTNKLKLLDLSNNNIEIFPENFRRQIDHKIASHLPTLTIDLSGNPISCTCGIESFNSIKWLSSVQKFVHLKNVHMLTCTGKYLITGVSTISEKVIKQWKSECFQSPWYIVIGIVPSIICGIFLGVGALCCYKKRYIIGYKIFKCQQSIERCYTPESQENTKWEYDAFISYCSDDRFWVHSSLMKTLEERYGFKLCIHYRDFPVGGSIVDTIISKMNNSRHLIVVISDVSMNSEWCQFELIQAMNQANKLNKTVIAIQLGDLKLINQNPTAGHILQTHVCLHWNDQNSKSQVYFWKKLVSALYDEQEGLWGCCCALGSTSIKYDQIYDIDDH